MYADWLEDFDLTVTSEDIKNFTYEKYNKKVKNVSVYIIYF